MRKDSAASRALRMQRFGVEDKEDWHGWCQRIPAIPMRDDWQIKVIPPDMGAMARFVITWGKSSVSVYLDVFDRLGSFGYGSDPVPHWEIYPDAAGENWRCPMEDVDELVEAIEASLDQQDWKEAPREPVMQMKPIEGEPFWATLPTGRTFCRPLGSREYLELNDLDIAGVEIPDFRFPATPVFSKSVIGSTPLDLEAKPKEALDWMTGKRFQVGDFVTQDGTDRQRIVEIGEHSDIMLVECIKAPLGWLNEDGGRDKPWCEVGEQEWNLPRRYWYPDDLVIEGDVGD